MVLHPVRDALQKPLLAGTYDDSPTDPKILGTRIGQTIAPDSPLQCLGVERALFALLLPCADGDIRTNTDNPKIRAAQFANAIPPLICTRIFCAASSAA